jgi:ribosomal protein L15
LEKKVIKAGKKVTKIKILGTGDIAAKLAFDGVEVSDSARQKIEKAGGTIALAR